MSVVQSDGEQHLFIAQWWTLLFLFSKTYITGWKGVPAHDCVGWSCFLQVFPDVSSQMTKGKRETGGAKAVTYTWTVHDDSGYSFKE